VNWAAVMATNWVVGWVAAVSWAGWQREKTDQEGHEKTERENKVLPSFNNQSK
jgi:hypothetical protein